MFVLMNALVDSEMTDFTVLNPLLTEEELDTLYGTNKNVSIDTLKDARKTELFGTLNVEKDSTMLVVVFVLLIALVDGLISVFLAKNPAVTEEESDMPFLSD